MKTAIKTTFATLLAAVLTTSFAFATPASGSLKETSYVKPAMQGINKIWVSGNVKLVLTQGNEESICGNESYDSGNTSVQSKGQTLYINSSSAQQVTLNITLKDLQRIEAYGQSVVLTSNNFDVKYLQVFLNQSAKAKVTALTGSLYTVVNDDATLKMSGMTHDHTLVARNMKNVKLTDLVCIRNSNAPMAKAARLAGLAK